MPESLGSLVDRLSVVNIKIFMVQDRVHAAAASGEGLDAETTGKLVSLNLARSQLINEINAAAGEEAAPIVKILDVQGGKS